MNTTTSALDVTPVTFTVPVIIPPAADDPSRAARSTTMSAAHSDGTERRTCFVMSLLIPLYNQSCLAIERVPSRRFMIGHPPIASEKSGIPSR